MPYVPLPLRPRRRPLLVSVHVLGMYIKSLLAIISLRYYVKTLEMRGVNVLQMAYCVNNIHTLHGTEPLTGIIPMYQLVGCSREVPAAVNRVRSLTLHLGAVSWMEASRVSDPLPSLSCYLAPYKLERGLEPPHHTSDFYISLYTSTFSS